MFNGGAWQTIATVQNPAYFDNGLTSSTAYVYRVRAIGPGGSSAYSVPDLATTIMFTDDPIVAGQTTILGTHLTEVRNAANAVRLTAAQTTLSWTDSPIVPGSTLIRATHIQELRDSLTSSFGVLGIPVPTFANSIAAGTIIHAADVQELRTAVH